MLHRSLGDVADLRSDQIHLLRASADSFASLLLYEILASNGLKIVIVQLVVPHNQPLSRGLFGKLEEFFDHSIVTHGHQSQDTHHNDDTRHVHAEVRRSHGFAHADDLLFYLVSHLVVLSQLGVDHLTVNLDRSIVQLKAVPLGFRQGVEGIGVQLDFRSLFGSLDSVEGLVLH